MRALSGAESLDMANTSSNSSMIEFQYLLRPFMLVLDSPYITKRDL
jgi:hypothetical protein